VREREEKFLLALIQLASKVCTVAILDVHAEGTTNSIVELTPCALVTVNSSSIDYSGTRNSEPKVSNVELKFFFLYDN
jgi:hypothetical protein